MLFIYFMIGIIAFIIIVLFWKKLKSKSKSKSFLENNKDYGTLIISNVKGTDFIEAVRINQKKPVFEVKDGVIHYYLVPGKQNIEIMITRKEKYEYTRKSEVVELDIHNEEKYLMSYNFETNTFVINKY